MPIYEFLCEDCDYVFEVWNSTTVKETAATIKCQKCGGNRLIQLVSKVSVLSQSKGSGIKPGGGACCCGGKC